MSEVNISELIDKMTEALLECESEESFTAQVDEILKSCSEDTQQKAIESFSTIFNTEPIEKTKLFKLN